MRSLIQTAKITNTLTPPNKRKEKKEIKSSFELFLH